MFHNFISNPSVFCSFLCACSSALYSFIFYLLFFYFPALLCAFFNILVDFLMHHRQVGKI